MERLVQQSGILDPRTLSAPILVVGAGAIGSFTVLNLAKMGFNDITVVDFDKVDEHNPDNQLYGKVHVNEMKVNKLHEIVAELSNIGITPVIGKFPEEGNSLLSNKKILILAIDSLEGRKVIWNFLEGLSAFPLWMIDARMGAELFSIYTVRMQSQIKRLWYPGTLWEQKDIPDIPCTEKSIMYCPSVVAGFIANKVKKLVQHQKYSPAISFNMKGMYQLLEYAPLEDS